MPLARKLCSMYLCSMCLFELRLWSYVVLVYDPVFIRRESLCTLSVSLHNFGRLVHAIVLVPSLLLLYFKILSEEN
jgi:hypothetical protein